MVKELPSDLGGMRLKQMPEWLTNNTPRTSGRRTFATWKHWKAENPLLPSGLLGPVRVMRTEPSLPAGEVR